MEVQVVHEERYWYPDDGGQVWLAGYTPVADDGRYLGRDAPELAARGLRVASVAGAGRHHDDRRRGRARAGRSSCAATPATSTTRTRSRCWPAAS